LIDWDCTFKIKEGAINDQEFERKTRKEAEDLLCQLWQENLFRQKFLLPEMRRSDDFKLRRKDGEN